MKSLTILARGKNFAKNYLMTDVRCPKEGDVWAVNRPLVWDRVSKIFAADPIASINRVYPDFTDKVNEYRVPVYLQKVTPDIPTSIRYPIEEVVEYFNGASYFTNTVCYIMAFAIMSGYDEIKFCGIDEQGEDKFPEKAGVEYWVGMARGRGIDVQIPLDSDVCRRNNKPQFYGYGLDTVEQIQLVNSL